MKPDFALSLSFDGIDLLQRAAGGWRSVGTVPPSEPDLTKALSDLRERGEALGDGPMRCKIVVPNDQVRYLTVETGPFSGDARLEMVRSALDGATPYALDDLAFDISADESETHVAAVAKETLAEAEAFAVDHGFNPVSFVAAPEDSPFLGEPFFGPTAHAATLDDAGEVEPDGIAVVVIGPAEGPTPSAEVDNAIGGFTSQRQAAHTLESGKMPGEPPGDAPPDTAPAVPQPIEGVRRDEPAPDPLRPAPSAKRGARTDEETVAPPSAASVTSPSLEFADTEPSAPKAGFRSRRSTPLRIEPGESSDAAPASAPTAFVPADPIPDTRPEPGAAPAPDMSARPLNPEPIPVAEDDLNAALSASNGFAGGEVVTTEEEATRLTVFGAREPTTIGGKPRHLGLILTAALLLFLAAVALWATLFLEDGIAGLFRSTPETPPVVAVAGTPTIGGAARAPSGDLSSDGLPAQSASLGTPTDEPQERQTGEQATSPAPDVMASLPDATVAAEDPPVTGVPTQPEETAETAPASKLTDTDAAVLDALGQLPTDGDAEEPDLPDAVAQGDPADPVREEARYAATGIWQTPPVVPETPAIIGLDDLYVASIDRTDLFQDAVALPETPATNPDRLPATVSLPAAAGTSFDLDETGLVEATPDGTLNPDGVIVRLGRPPVVPPPTPDRPEAQPTEAGPSLEALASARPRARPVDLAETFERGQLGGLTRDELAELRPRARPLTAKQEAERDETPTAQAVVVSRIPLNRPRGFETIVQKSRRENPATQTAAATPAPAATTSSTSAPASTSSGANESSRGSQVASVAPRTVKPKIPSSASVARQATLNNAINLRQVNLIGVYGTPSNRRALVRLPSGRYKKVKVGDSVDGGRVVAIGDSELRYQKGGRNLTLKIPRG